MQPSYGVLSFEVEQTFGEGRWEELERLYRGILAKDSSDAKTAFRLANLLAYQERYREALPFYDTAWTHGWPGALALANKGVALACLGETRAAFKAFDDASRHDAGCRPALYNLGILFKKLGDEGSLPAVIADLGLGTRDQSGSERQKFYFQKISWPKPGEDPWAGTEPSERPLFLWLDDLKPGFGFEPINVVVNVEEAYVLYEEGQRLLEEGRWQEAISKLDAAADLHPKAFADRIKAPRMEAQAAIARSHFSEIRTLWDQNDFDGATQVFDELLSQGADLSDRAFADVIVESGINELAGRIRTHKPKDGWETLQKLITSARQRVEPNGGSASQNAPEATAEAASGEAAEDGAPGPSEGRTESQQGGPEPPSEFPGAGPASFQTGSGSGEHIRSVCSGAWRKQIGYLLQRGDYEPAIALLEFPGIDWFAADELPRWRQRVYTAKAEILSAEGRDHMAATEWRAAAACFQEGRAAALQTGDARVVDTLDSAIAELLEIVPPEERDEIGNTFNGRDDREELRRVARDLEMHPGEPRLLKQRAALVAELLSRVEESLVAEQWKKAMELADEILEAEPGQAAARKLRRRAKKELIAERLELAQDALDRGQSEKAEAFCAEIAELHPQHQGIAKIRRAILAIEAARSRDEGGPSAFDLAYLAYLEARDAGDAEAALGQALAMRKLKPGDSHTQEALDWVPGAYVHSLRVQLEKSRTALTAEGLLEKLKLLFYLEPKFAPARELSRELRQVTKDYSDKRRQASFAKLGEAEDALLANDPESALEALREVREADLLQEAAEKRAEAIAILREQIEDLLANPSTAEREDGERLLGICQRWDPDFVVAKRREMQQRGAQLSEERLLDQEVARLDGQLRRNTAHPFRALRELDREIRALDIAGKDVRSRRRSEIHALRQRARRSMTPVVRWAAWFYDLYYSTELPPEPSAPKTEGGRRGNR